MKLTENIYLVGSGRAGFSMTHPLDCHVYLIDGGEELALIDCGAGFGLEQILKNVELSGFDSRRVRQILITHAHGDHAGGAARARRLTNALVTAAHESAEWLRNGNEDAISLAEARRAGIYPSDYRLEPCPVDREVEDGDEIRVGSVVLQAISTPGHSRGHLSYLTRVGDQTCLFAGDAMFAGGRILLQGTWDCSIQESLATIRKLAALPIDVLLPGHAEIILGEASYHFTQAMSWVDRLLPPPQLHA